METIKATTKRGQGFIASHNRSGISELYACYDKPSDAKKRAYARCLSQCMKEHGSDFRILSYNTFSFTVAWTTEEGLRVETSTNSYIVK